MSSKMGSFLSKPQKNQEAMSTSPKNHLDITPEVRAKTGIFSLDGTFEGSFDGPFPLVASESTGSEMGPPNTSGASQHPRQRTEAESESPPNTSGASQHPRQPAEAEPESDSSLQIIEELSTPAAKKAAVSPPTPQSRPPVQLSPPNTKAGLQFDSSDSDIGPRIVKRSSQSPETPLSSTKPDPEPASSDSDIRPPITRRARRAPAALPQPSTPPPKPASDSDSSLQILEDISAPPARIQASPAHPSPSPPPRPRPLYTLLPHRSASQRQSRRLREREEMRRVVERANRRSKRLAIRNRARRARQAAALSDEGSANGERQHPSVEQANMDPSELIELSDDESEMDVNDNSQAKFVGWTGDGDKVMDEVDDWHNDEIPASGEEVILTVSSSVDGEEEKENKQDDVEMADVDRSSQTQTHSDPMDVDLIPSERQYVDLSTLPVIDDFRLLQPVSTNNLPPAQAVERTSRINQLRRRQREMMGTSSRKGKGLSAEAAFGKAVERVEELAGERGAYVASDAVPGSGVSEVGDEEVVMEVMMKDGPSWQVERTLDDVRANLEARVLFMEERMGRK